MRNPCLSPAHAHANHQTPHSTVGSDSTSDLMPTAPWKYASRRCLTPTWKRIPDLTDERKRDLMTPTAPIPTRNRLSHRSPRATSDGFWTCSLTTAARGIESSLPLPSSRRNMGGVELSRHSQPPCPALPPADCGKTRFEVSSTGADVGRPRRAIPLEASHPSPLSIYPPLWVADRTCTKRKACGCASHLFRAEASRRCMDSSPEAG